MGGTLLMALHGLWRIRGCIKVLCVEWGSTKGFRHMYICGDGKRQGLLTIAVLPLTIKYTIVARWRSPVGRIASLVGLTVQAHYLSRYSHYPLPQPQAQLSLIQGDIVWLTLENGNGAGTRNYYWEDIPSEKSSLVLIGASVSKPQTSELNCEISLMYVYMYPMLYVVRRTSSARVRTLCTDTMHVIWLGTRVHTFIVRFYSCFAACSEHVYSEYFRRALKPSQPRQGKQVGYCTHENERESPTCSRNSRAQAGKINKDYRCINLCKYPIVHCAYIHCKHAVYTYTIQLAHTRPTMHHICLVISCLDLGHA